ncbi:MAG: hypothetical protein K9J12_11570 [Melioribacteraceae bacterium]|nr:hypothetical protein [Melioribacteraceae bacterium]MCF8264963.1 hypothetical protein [Melioribacteraceae bacterium]MCF8411773.1 hypothetical protein [Melioribacteraceae bacterium]MCF8431407.1 hypothetical protein [Melioribacteraceae bacterium]
MTKTILLFFLVFLLNTAIFPQIKITEVSPELISIEQPDSYSGSIRKVEMLSENWSVFESDNPQSKVKVTIPNFFEGVDELVYQTKFDLSESDIAQNNIVVKFLGISYSADILINDQRIHRHNNGLLPFEVLIPSDLLKFSQPNILTIYVSYSPDDLSTIPLKGSFLKSKEVGGVLREVSLNFIPKNYLNNLDLSFELNNQFSSAKFTLSGETVFSSDDDVVNISDYSVLIELFRSDIENPVLSVTGSLDSLNASLANFTSVFELKNPALWAPEVPNRYMIKTKLLKQSELVDEILTEKSLYKTTNESGRVLFNNYETVFFGTIYQDWSESINPLFSLKTGKQYIRVLKELGFNSIRFKNNLPHPAFLKLCESEGIYCFIDIPLNNASKKVFEGDNFNERIDQFVDEFINSYNNSNSVIGFGVGSGFVGNQTELQFVSRIANKIKNKSNKLVYGSFYGFNFFSDENLDWIGAELYSQNPADFSESIARLQNDERLRNYFFSEIVYPTFEGHKNGYSNKYSNEAQAKYFNDVFNFARDNKLRGIFINSLTDFQATGNRMFTGYSESDEIRVGIIPSLSNTNTLSFKVIQSKTKKGEKVSVPIGRKEDESPLLFIIIGLVLSILMTIIINSKRKFREDATRALIRPYNFFADIRDQRIITDLHTNFLLIIVAGTISLLITNLLFFFRSNLLLEKILLSFDSVALINTFSYLAYHPTNAFLWILLACIIFPLLLTLIIKATSGFVKNRVVFASVYSVVTWSFLPFILLLPLLLVLYKVLEANTINYYIYAGIALFIIWLFKRLFKGIYVIFDVNPWQVYLSSIIIFVVVIGGGLLYFELTESTISNILHSIKQYQILQAGV